MLLKNSFFLVLLVILSFHYLSAQQRKLILNDRKTNGCIVKDKAFSHFTVEHHLDEINTLQVQTPLGFFTELILPGYSATQQTGAPMLPVYRRLIEVPSGATVKINVLRSHYQDISLNDYNLAVVIPAQPPQIKAEDNFLKFQYDSLFYQQDTFHPQQQVTVDILGMMRGLRMGRLNIFPVQYNPVANVLRIYDEMVVEIFFRDADEWATSLNRQKNRDPYFKNLNQNLLNTLTESRPLDTMTQYPVKYVIVSNPMFQETLQPFIQWKRKKGFNVIEAYTDNPLVGSTAASIKNYLQGLYDAATPEDPAPSFVLLAGDVAQCPTFTGNTGAHPSDLYYCEYTGDYLPDAYYGRFSAVSTSQLLSQVNKTLQYEQYLMPDAAFLDQCVMVAGMDASFGSTHANGQINYGTSVYFNLAHGLNSHTYLYPASGSQGSQIIQDVSDGCCYANYTAHGSSSGWASPSFTTANIPTLANNGKYPLMVGNACLTNKFNDPECFGEALLRAVDKGALGYIGASNNTYWNEDFYWAVGAKPVSVNPSYSSSALGAYDRTFHDHGENYSEWFMTQGQMIFAGNLAVTQGSPSASQYYWEIYHLMGDPSLMVYFSPPSALPVSYGIPVITGYDQFVINTAPYAYAAVSKDDTLHGAAQADNNGLAVISLLPFTSPGTADIVVTGQNYQPFISTVPVETTASPLCLYAGDTIIDFIGNHNGEADFGETIFLGLSIKNFGLQTAHGVSASISTLDPYIYLYDSITFFDSIQAGDIVSSMDGLSCTVSSDIPDSHTVHWTLSVADSSQSWVSYFNTIIHSPVLSMAGAIVSDPLGNQNNRLDQGETATLIITLRNMGTASAENITTTLFSGSNYLTVIDNNGYIPSLGAGLLAQQAYCITASSAAQSGTHVQLMLVLNINNIRMDTLLFAVVIGQEPVLILNLDGNNNSAQYISNAMAANNIFPTVLTALPVDLSTYESVFICLGIYNNNHILTYSEGSALASYLSGGGRIYMEGGDTWYINTGTPVHPMFKIAGTTNGTNDLDTLNGQSGTFTAGMRFKYSGDNNLIDRISPVSSSTSFSVLKNTSPVYSTAIAYDAGSYKTIGASHEFGGLSDEPGFTSRSLLMRKYLEFFDLIAQPPTAGFTASSTTVSQGSNITFNDTSTGSPGFRYWSFPGGIPSSSFQQNPSVTYNYPGNYPVELVVTNSDGSDTLIKNNYIKVNPADHATITVGSYSGCGSSFQVPVMVSSLADAASISLMLSFNQANLAYIGYSGINPLLNNGIVMINQSAGTVYFTYASLSPISIYSDTLFNLTFLPVNIGVFPLEWNTTVPGNCEISDFDGDIIPASFLDGQIEITNAGTAVSVMISADPGTQVCQGEEVTFTAYGYNTGLNPQYLWKRNDSVIAAGSLFTTSDLINGDVITCQLTSDASCASGNPALSNTLTMQTDLPPTINLGNDTLLPYGQSITLAAGEGFQSYLWSTGEISSSITVSVNGTYFVTAATSSGCTASDTIVISFLNYNSITGNLYYANYYHTPLGSVQLRLMNGNILESQTNSGEDGSFVFEPVDPGNYQVAVSCLKPWGGVNATDALLTMKHFVGMSFLSGLYMKAADVDLSSMINALDALFIQRRSVGYLNSFPAGNWIFQKPVLSFTGMEPLNVSIQGLCVGDVNGSHLPQVKNENTIMLEIINITASRKDKILELPVRVENIAHLGAVSLYFSIPPEIEISEIKGGILQGNLLWNYDKDLLSVSWYSLDGQACYPGDILFTIGAKVLPTGSRGIKAGIQLLPQSEVADENAFVISPMTLSMPGLITPTATAMTASVSPNPFRDETKISITLDGNFNVSVKVYDITGRLIKSIPERKLPSGNIEISWDGTNDKKDKVKSGIYYLQVISERKSVILPLIKTGD